MFIDLSLSMQCHTEDFQEKVSNLKVFHFIRLMSLSQKAWFHFQSGIWNPASVVEAKTKQKACFPDPDLDPDLDPWSFPFWSKPRSKCLPGSVVLPVFANRGYRLIQYSSHHQISTIPYKRKSGDLILTLYKEIWLKESMNKTFGKGDSLI